MRSANLRNFSATFSLAALFVACTASANPEGVLCNRNDPCNAKGIYSKHSPGPTKGDSVRLNPAEVPFESITGLEAIYYKSTYDFSLVKGLGRVGAALSPSNNQETFFGAPAPEDPGLQYIRMDERSEYVAPKYVLAGGINLISREGEGLSHVELSVGAMGRYNKVLGRLTPGGGVTAAIGPLSLGAAMYDDLDVIESSVPGVSPVEMKSKVSVLSGGLTLQSVSLDYSFLNVAANIPSTASVFTLTAYVGRAILTAARREVVSDKLAYDFPTRLLVFRPDKVDYFAGFQYRIAPFLVVGLFYDYYLLHELSIGATVFF